MTLTAEQPADLAARGRARVQRLRSRVPPALRYCVGVYLAVRIALFVLGAAAWGLTNEHAFPPAIPGHHNLPLTNGWHNAITGWVKMDGLWLLWVAQHGYSNHDVTAPFYPGYPMLTHLLGYLCLGNLTMAGYLVSNGALLAALVVLYQLTEHEYDQATARRAVLYLCLFPTAFFLFDTYSESVFLLAAVGALALARRGRWGWAGLVGIGATLSRSAGVVLALALAAEAIHQTVEDHARLAHMPAARGLAARCALRLAASAVPLAGTAGYLLFWQLRFHDWYRPIRLERTVWRRHFGWPWHNLPQGMALAWHHLPVAGQGEWAVDFAVVAAGLVLAVWVAARARPVYTVYTWGSILLFLSSGQLTRPLVSDPRYLVTLFPLTWALARLGRRRQAHEAAVALSAGSLAIVSWLFLGTNSIY